MSVYESSVLNISEILAQRSMLLSRKTDGSLWLARVKQPRLLMWTAIIQLHNRHVKDKIIIHTSSSSWIRKLSQELTDGHLLLFVTDRKKAALYDQMASEQNFKQNKL